MFLPLAATALPVPTLNQVQEKMAGLAVPFEENQGQFAAEVAFAARTFAGTLFVTRDGKVVHALAGRPEQLKAAKQDKGAQRKKEGQQADRMAASSSTRDDRVRNSQTPSGPGWSLVETLEGARKLVPAGSQPSGTRVSRFVGSDASQWHADIATFERVRMGEAWPGVSVELAARGNNVEKLFTVAPGTNPKTIRMRVAGAKRLRLGDDGSLIATTGNGDVAFTPPVAFQDIGQKRHTIPVRYQLLANNSYRFEVTRGYDRSQPLVIDPLLQSTYLGGSRSDQVNALARDASGNVLVAGYTDSANFPGTIGGGQVLGPGGFYTTDAFVARLSGDLRTLLQAVYLGGIANDVATALALDASGNVLVAGVTGSINFPGTTGGAQPEYADGGRDAFVARLTGGLTSLVQASFLGGTGYDGATALALDASGNVLVTGLTGSTDFPGTAGGAQPANIGGFRNIFVSRLSSTLQSQSQATYFGGSDGAEVTALALDASGKVLIAGNTFSTDLPGTTGGAQVANGGGNSRDGLVARLAGDLKTLVQATYLGGSGFDAANALAFDASGNVLVAGVTSSTNFPGTTGGAQAANGGIQDAFVARLSGNLQTLVQATYIGGIGSDQANALALDAGGNVLVAGQTTSSNFPRTTGGVQPAYGSGGDAFAARISSNLQTPMQATYLGGSGNDRVFALLLDASGNVLVAGSTRSTSFPGTTGTTGGAQPAYGGDSGIDSSGDGFVTKLSANLQLSGDLVFSNGFD